MAVTLNFKFVGGEKKVRTDAVYITQLPDDVTEAKLGEYFGSIGVIKVCIMKHARCCVSTLCVLLRQTRRPEDLTSTCTPTRGQEISRYHGSENIEYTII